MKNLVERIKAALQQLAPRERVMVIGGAVVVLLTVLYAGVWDPLVHSQAERRQALEQARTLSARIEQIAVRVQNSGPARSVDRSTSLLAVVDQTSRSETLGKAPSRVQPEGDREVKVWLEGVAFDNLLRWLQELEARYDIRASSAEIERGDAAGVVDARVTLARP